MAIPVKQLYTKIDRKPYYPKTVLSAVFDKTGNDAQNVLDAMRDEIQLQASGAILDESVTLQKLSIDMQKKLTSITTADVTTHFDKDTSELAGVGYITDEAVSISKGDKVKLAVGDSLTLVDGTEIWKATTGDDTFTATSNVNYYIVTSDTSGTVGYDSIHTEANFEVADGTITLDKLSSGVQNSINEAGSADETTITKDATTKQMSVKDGGISEAKLDTALAAKINGKVDAEAGKGLSTNDYTTSDKDKLAALPTNAELETSLDGKVDAETGKGLSTNDYTTDEKTKLGALPTATELATSLSGKVDAESGKGLSSNDYTDADKSKIDALPDATSLTADLDGKVDKESGKGLSSNDYTTAEKTKLSALPTAAEITTSLSGKVDVVSGKGLSTNDYSTAEKTKLTALPTNDELTASLALKANIASPALTGTPTAPTAASGTNTTQIATTAFVTSAVSAETTARGAAIATVEASVASCRTDLDAQVAKEAADVANLQEQINAGVATSGTITMSATMDNTTDYSAETDVAPSRAAVQAYVKQQIALLEAKIAAMRAAASDTADYPDFNV